VLGIGDVSLSHKSTGTVLLFLKTILVYDSSTGRYIIMFTYVIAIYLRVAPSIVLPHPPSPFLEQIPQVPLFYFNT
jgi:hypothetical protein